MKLVEIQNTNLLSKYGTLAADTEFFMHGFSEFSYFISAVKRGKFGRKSFTSIGNEHSIIKKNFSNHIWFRRPQNISPVLYVESVHTIPDELLNKFPRNPINKEIQDVFHLKEQEWYSYSELYLTDLEIVGLVFSEYETFDHPLAINFDDFREHQYDIRNLM